MKLSACIITYNEEQNIRACIESVHFADETVVIDSNSTDKTAEIAKSMGARVIVKDWSSYFEQKNYALEAAQGDWLLSIDADERVTPELQSEIVRALADPSCPHDGFSMPRRTFYLGRYVRHCGWYPDRKVRLVRRGHGRWIGASLHEELHVPGPVRRLQSDLLHFSYRDLSDHLKRIDSYTTLAAREKRKRGERALPMLLLAPPFKFMKTYLLKLGFLDGMQGFVIAALGSYYIFLKYAKLLELEMQNRNAEI